MADPVARGCEFAVAADARDNSRAVLGLFAPTLAVIIRDCLVSLTFILGIGDVE